MKLKTLIYCCIFMVSTASCSKQFIEPESLTQPQATTLKSTVIGTKYYVGKTGSNTNSGTLSAPFLTIQKGLDVAKAGDTVFVKVGSYNEYVTFGTSGVAGSPIVLKNYGKDVVTVDAQSTRSYCIYAANKSYIVVDGVNISNSANYNVLLSGCANVNLKNLSSALTIGAGAINIDVEASTTSWGTNITLQDVSTYGGQIGAYFKSKINGVNIIRGHYNYATLDGINITGATIADTANYNRNFVIDGSETSYNSRQGIITWCVKKATFKNFWSHHNSATGLQVENYSSYITVQDFLCEDNSRGDVFETGLWIDDSDSVTVRRGIMRNNQTGFRVSGSRNVLAYDLLIYSNQDGLASGMINTSGVNFYSNPSTDAYPSLYMCNVKLYHSVIDGNSATTSQRGAITLQGEGSYTIKNCIVSNDQSAYDIYIAGSCTLTSDYNLFYNTRAVNIFYSPTTSWVAPKTWSAYKTACGQDTHSINSNPLFISSTDYHLQSVSPAINAGLKVGLASDFVGYGITGLPDIGAYKFQGSNSIAATIYYNVQTSATAVKNSCGTGFNGSTVTYTVSVNKYSSTVSQVDADNQALADLNNNKQAYANANGTCSAIAATVYYNTQVSGTAAKNSCGTGYTGSTVTYTVSANKYSSSVSQSDADTKALADLTTNKQAYANTNGTCTAISLKVYSNTQVSATATKNSCGTGYIGSRVTYTISAGIYTSTASQADADAKAASDLSTNTQTYANLNGICTKLKRWR